ncbi:hemoglobin subunit beta-like [Heptranchias perlo]|uniref:hemoglobin subunit beta-like n=1 Tax=Heptranchias perlo TaxID=212740 RepID=UPI00355A1732
MVHWVGHEKDHIISIWSSLKKDVIGPKVLERMFVVYPWTQKYFPFDGKFKAEDHPVKVHADKVVSALDIAVAHLDSVKDNFTELSKKHADIFHVDVENFKLLADCFIIELAHCLQVKFTPEVQVAWEKFFKVVVDALSKEYH